MESRVSIPVNSSLSLKKFNFASDCKNIETDYENLYYKVDCLTVDYRYGVKIELNDYINKTVLMLNPSKDFDLIIEVYPKIEVLNYIMLMMCRDDVYVNVVRDLVC